MRVLFPRYALVASDLGRELERAGIEVHWVSPAELSVERFDEAVDAGVVDAVVSVNFSPELAWLASRRGRTYVSWTIDPLPASRLALLSGVDPSHCIAFAHSERTVGMLRACGIERASWLPLAAPGARRAPIRADDSALDPYRVFASFVGTTLETEHDRFVELLLSPGVSDEVFCAWESWVDELARGPADHASFASDGTIELPASLLAQSPASIDRGRLADAVLGTLSHRLRTRRVEAVVRHRLDVYGDAAWARFSCRYRGPADHGEELTRIYAASTITLDLPRLHQREIVTMRVFDALAAGGLVVSERSTDIARCFVEGEHVRTYSNTEELLSLLDELASSPREVARLSAAGRAHVQANHLIEHRAGAVVEALRNPR